MSEGLSNQRGVTAEDRLIEAAIAEFGRNGIDGASTRRIASRAGAVMSAITYHFGGKEGLYCAAAARVASRFSGPSVASSLEVRAMSSDEARGAIQQTLAAFVDILLVDMPEEWALFFIREQISPTIAFDCIYELAIRPIVDPLCQLVRVATRTDDDTAAKLATISLVGQVVVLRSGGAFCRRLLEVEDLTPDLVNQMKHRVWVNCDAILSAMESRQSV